MAEIGNIWVRIGAKIDDFKKGTTDVEKALQKIGDKAQDWGKKFAIAGGAVTAALGVIITKTANAGDAFNDLSQRTGISVEMLSSFKLAADKSGSSIEGFAVGMRALASNMQEAATKGGDSKKIFDALGVSVKNADGSLRPLDDVMLDVADKFSMMEDGALKVDLAVKIFGKSGMDLIPMLNMGKKGLEEEAEAAKKNGIWTTEAAKRADAFNDALENLKSSVAGASQEIGNQLLPVIKSIVDKVTTVVTSFTSWAKANPELTKTIGGVAAAAGGLATVMGTTLMVIGSLVQRLAGLSAALKLTMGSVAATTALFSAGLVTIGIYVSKLIELRAAEDKATEASKRLAEKENESIEVLSEAAVAAGWHYGQMSKLIAAYDGNIAALTMAIKQGKYGKEIEEALTAARKKHTEEIEKQKEKTAQFIPKIQEEAEKLKTLKEELGLTFRSDIQEKIDKLNRALIEYKGKFTADQIRAITEEINALQLQLSGLANMPSPKAFKDLLNDFNKLGSSDAFPGVLDNFSKVEGGLGDLAGTTKETMSEISTIVSDAMREIGRSIVDVFNIKGIFGVEGKTPEFDSSYYDAMIEAAEEAYGRNKELIEENIEAIRDAADKEIDAIEREYDAMIDAADKAFDHSELMIRRQEEDEDIRLSRQYENQREAMENAKLMSKEERDAIINNVNLTQKEKDKLLKNAFTSEAERKQALKKLEIKYENDKLARERAREDAKLAREEAQEVKLEAIRQAGRDKEQAARDAAAVKEEEFLTNLLNLEKEHEKEKDAIRAAEDKARQKLADDEEKRQNSLWFKVKGIFATAIEEMATVWITKFVGNLISGLGDIGTTIKDTVGGALDTVSKTAGSIASGLLSSLGSIGSIISGITSVLELFKGPQKQTDVTYWLKLISDNTQEIHDWLFMNAQEKLNYYADKLEDIKTVIIDGIRSPLNAVCDKLDWIGGMTTNIRDSAQAAASALKNLPKAQHGAIVSKPSLVSVAEAGPEAIVPLSGAGSGAISVSIQPVVIDKGDKYIIEFIQKSINRGNIRIPVTSVGAS